jgi:hypothetical protein
MIAFDASGNALCIWSQSDGTQRHVWSNRFSAGQGRWETAIQIEQTNESAAAPTIAVDPSGNAVAIWATLSADNGQNIWTNRYRTGAAWSTATKLATYASRPIVNLDRDGNGFALWEQHDTSSQPIGLRANRFLLSSGFNPASQLGSATNKPLSESALAFDGGNNALALWKHDQSSVYASQFETNEVQWTTPTSIASNTANDVGSVQLRADNSDVRAFWVFENAIWTALYD